MSVRIGIGTALGSGLSPSEYWDWIEYCEGAGIDSVWHSDQLLGPTLEPMTMLAALAARTSKMRFGTNALVIAFRDPLVIAKEIATIDYLSEGRMLPVFGVGNGSDPFWAATGTSSKGRGGRANEAIALVRALLEQDEVEFAGEHFTYRGPGVSPRPSKPIPLWIGGNSPAALRRTAKMGDGWLGSLIDPVKAGAARQGIESALADTGRVIDPDHYGITLFMRIGGDHDAAVIQMRKRLAGLRAKSDGEIAAPALTTGNPDEIAALLKKYVAAGMSKFVALPMASDAEDLMEQTRLLTREVLPQVENT